ncbi:MAG: phytanoyl-CoA dioxygenase family protein [Planctomycetota bacterium]|nr:phytanoyl-CoA dioxygenase family protein [Planctomycetota bacterium]
MSLRSDWQRDGFLVLPSVLDPTALHALREAADHALAQWRASSSADSEPGAFWNSPDGWILIHLNHPKYYAGRDELLARVLNAIATPAAIDAVTQVMGEPPVFMQANYYLDPRERQTAGGGHWHRDCQFFSKGDDLVEQRLRAEEADPPRELHMHIPLVPTAASGLVPGSHARWDTPGELAVRRNNPTGAMPGGIRLQLQPRDIAMFHVNTIHRGYYEVGVPRRTIAVTFGAASRTRPFDAHWWKMTRGYVASFQPWFRKPGYLAGTEPHTLELFQRYINAHGHEWVASNLHPEAIGPQRLEYFKLYE